MIPTTSYLLVNNSVLDLVEWFIASVALVVAVSLIYAFILNKSPSPEGITQLKSEQMHTDATAEQSISLARDAVKNCEYSKSIDLAVTAVSSSFRALLRNTGTDLSNMNVGDMAYLVQSKVTGAPNITQPIYQLNLLRLKSAQSQAITAQEADWAINTASWLVQLISTQQIRL